MAKQKSIFELPEKESRKLIVNAINELKIKVNNLQKEKKLQGMELDELRSRIDELDSSIC